MCALLTALSSACIARLEGTWALTGRKAHLDGLMKYIDPTGRFRAYRSLLQNTEGPALPFVSTFLTDIVHIAQLPDTLPPPSPSPHHHTTSQPEPLINFAKRERFYTVISTILKYQSQTYNFLESEEVRVFVETQLAAAEAVNGEDPEWFWTKCKEVQQMEFLANLDGLYRGGF
jgi:son of sevenless